MTDRAKPHVERVLVYQNGYLGDTLVSVPSYYAIRGHFGNDAHITVIHNIPADIRATPIAVLHASGLVNDFMGYDQTHGESTWRDAIKLWQKILRHRPDVIVYLAP